MRKLYQILLIIVVICGCTPGVVSGNQPAEPTNTPTPVYLTPTQTKTLQPTPTKTPVKIQISATVWEQNPLVPIITYHQFPPPGITQSSMDGRKISLGDLRASLQSLYDSGFSLVSLEDWLAGNLTVAPGRRPLILTMDDLFFTNQILLGGSGKPKPDTGIGVIWQFYQEHPDFGFHLALFAILGDKFYPFDPQYSSETQYLGRNSESEFAQTIVWCLENDALVFNHTFLHGYLSNTIYTVTMSEFIHQLRQNDDRLRYYLKLAGREDLIPLLGNVIALPGGAEPQTESDWASLRAYKNPEGLPVQAVLAIYSPFSPPTTYKYFTSPYDPGFNKYNIPRIVATLYNIQYLVYHHTEFPAAQSCMISLEESRAQDDLYLIEQINAAIQSGACPAGSFFLNGKLFDAHTSPIVQISIP